MLVRFETSEETPWSKAIEKLVGLEFPTHHISTQTRLDAVMAELIGSKQTRLGPAPEPEALVKMREVVRSAIENDCTIPMLIPWAPKKYAIGVGVDVAELMALKQLYCLNQRVKRHHAKGLWIVVRIEDNTGLVVEQGKPGLEASMALYISGLKGLTEALGYDFIHYIQESDIVLPKLFVETAQELSFTFFHYLTPNSSPKLKEEMRLKLIDLGWKGGVSEEQIAYLVSRANKFKQSTTTDVMSYVANFLACVLARRRLNATGLHAAWTGGKFMQLTFSGPMPDEPADSTKLYYRTIPANMGRQHYQPWAAKGIIRIQEAGPVFGIESFQARAAIDYFPGNLRFYKPDGSSIDVGADCVMDAED